VVAVAEAVHRRHNMSAILRSCESFGVHEVHLVADGFTPSPGAARGAERWVRCRNFSTVGASLDELEARGFQIYAADFAPPRWTPEEVPVDRPIAVVFGTEAAGVSAAARARAVGSITIPRRSSCAPSRIGGGRWRGRISIRRSGRGSTGSGWSRSGCRAGGF
jgi:tRNA (guanosine-2'-O-)-methyltransferase